MNNVNIEGSNVGDKFKTRNGNIVELVYNTFDLEENKHKYLMYLSQSFPMSWFVYEDGRIDPNEDVSIDTSIAFAAMSSAFISGQGDFVSLFDDNV